MEHGPTAGECYRYWPEDRWQEVCKAAGVPSAAYDLRHTFITEQVSRGVPMAKVAKWAGNSVRVIEDRYSHLVPDHLREIVENLEDGLEDEEAVRDVRGESELTAEALGQEGDGEELEDAPA